MNVTGSDIVAAIIFFFMGGLAWFFSGYALATTPGVEGQLLALILLGVGALPMRFVVNVVREIRRP